MNPAVYCIHLPSSTARRERMERRFRHHGLDRARLVQAVELSTPRDNSQDSDYAAAEPEPPLSPLAPTPLFSDLLEAKFALNRGEATRVEEVELVKSVRVGDCGLLSIEGWGPPAPLGHARCRRGDHGDVPGLSLLRSGRGALDRPRRPWRHALSELRGDEVDALATCKVEDALALLSPV